MAIPFLLWAYWAAERRPSASSTGSWSSLALSWKEDVALFILMLGVLQLIRGARRLGLLTIGLALIWFAVFALLDGARRGRRRTVYGPLYGEPRRHARPRC